MMVVRFALLTDGSSDRVLIRPIGWVLRREAPDNAFQGEWADLSRLRRPPRALAERIQMAVELYPCEILFIHRDAEGQAIQQRWQEIDAALAQLDSPLSVPKVCVVPVRMTEAWLLFDEQAMRMASGNPSGRHPLELPALSDVEEIRDAKGVLHELLEAASGLSGRRRQRFRTGERVHRLAELVSDYSPLMQLTAFRTMVDQVKSVLPEILRQRE